MPLVTCPCEEMAPMKQVQRDGVEIDVCTKCRGVWIDRGELEKLLAVVVRQAEAEDIAPPAAAARPTAPAQPAQPFPPQAAPYPPQQPYPPQGGHYGGERGEYGEKGEGYYDPRYGYKKKKRFDIFDIFD
jgi:uncharacterized protein